MKKVFSSFTQIQLGIVFQNFPDIFLLQTSNLQAFVIFNIGCLNTKINSRSLSAFSIMSFLRVDFFCDDCKTACNESIKTSVEMEEVFTHSNQY